MKTFLIGLFLSLTSSALFADNNSPQNSIGIIESLPVPKKIMLTLDDLATCEIDSDNRLCSEIIEYNDRCYKRTEKVFFKVFESNGNKITMPVVETTVCYVDCNKQV